MAEADCLVIAHRGASSYAPENTHAAFERALALGAFHLELDLHCSLDGDLVVIHDAGLERTTNGRGLVHEHHTRELMGLDCGSWFSPEFQGEKMPLFDEVLERYRGRAHLHVEIKGQVGDVSRRFVDAVRRAGWREGITMTSFQIERIREVREFAPEMTTGWLVHEVTDEVVNTAFNLGIAQVNPKAAVLTAGQVEMLRSRGFVVRAWGVKDEALMARMVALRVDGMTVNFPDKLLALLRSQAGKA